MLRRLLYYCSHGAIDSRSATGLGRRSWDGRRNFAGTGFGPGGGSCPHRDVGKRAGGRSGRGFSGRRKTASCCAGSNSEVEFRGGLIGCGGDAVGGCATASAGGGG